MISDRSGFSPVAWNVYEVCLSDMFLQVQRFFLHGYEPPGLAVSCEIVKFGPN